MRPVLKLLVGLLVPLPIGCSNTSGGSANKVGAEQRSLSVEQQLEALEKSSRPRNNRQNPGEHWAPALPKAVFSAHGEFTIEPHFDSVEQLRDWVASLKPSSTLTFLRIGQRQVALALYPGFSGRRAYFLLGYIQSKRALDIFLVHSAGIDFTERPKTDFAATFSGNVVTFKNGDESIGKVDFTPFQHLKLK